MKKLLLVLLLFVYAMNEAPACTSGVVSSSRTKTGEVILWKHRDFSMRHTQVKYFTGGKYAYTALVGTDGSLYGGLNSAGFGCTTNVVRNLRSGYGPDEKAKVSHPYSLHTTALRECSTVDEFEAMLKKYQPCSKGFQHIIGVCDAKGGVAFFEVSDKGYTRFNADDAPEGYVVRSNFGFSGVDSARGTCERRYNIMNKIFSEHKKPFTVQDFVGFSRCFTSTNGDELNAPGEYLDDNWIIQRHSSCAEMVIVSGKNPRIFFSNGNAMAGMLTPVFVGGAIPKCLQLDGAMYQEAEAYHELAYIEKEKGKYYLNKPFVKAYLKANPYKVKDVPERPADTQKLADEQDARYAKYAKKLDAVIAKFK